MDELKIEMELSNGAFDGEDLANEIAACLRNLADRLEGQKREYLAGNGSKTYIKDSNGNTIGFCYFNINEEEE